METVVITAKPGKPELQQIVPELCRALEKRGYRVMGDEESAVYFPEIASTPRSEITKHDPAMVIVLGGDGTLLAIARAVAKSDVPILALNLGSLGFLTEVPLAELYATLDAIAEKRVAQDKRSLLTCEVERRGEVISEFIALNDVVITKST